MTNNERLIAGRYRVGDLVGRGGMAEVYEGVDTRLGRTVAIKLLKADLANDPNFESKFKQEAQASARMAHPTIVRVYDAGEEETVDKNGMPHKVPFIIMEFVRGRLLREIIHAGSIPAEKAIGYVAGILTALDVSHRAGVVHRDIKPANVMIVDGEGVKVMDFGIARAVSDNSATQAATGGIIGTAQYFSPEQARGDAVDGRTDLYSTGVILYEMLAGRPPFRGESAVSVAYQHVSEAVTPPSEHNPNVSPELDAVVLRALAKDRDERFQTAEEFREHLLAAAAGSPATMLTTMPMRPASDLHKTEMLGTAAGSGSDLQDSGLPTALLEGLTTAPERVVTSSEKVSNGVIWGLGTGVAVILIGLLFWVMTLSGGNNPIAPVSGVQVANVVGSAYEDAFNTLSQQELVVSRVFEQSDDVAVGTVIRQEPVAGTQVNRSTTVTLVVSSGAQEISVPNLAGLTEAEVLALLESQGLLLGTVTEVDSAAIAAGLVITSDPVANSKVSPSTPINLLLSNGKVQVPDVKNLAVLEARKILTDPAIGFTVSVEIEDAATCNGTPGNTVIRQSIAPGEADQKQAIILYVECVGSTEPTPTPTEEAPVDEG